MKKILSALLMLTMLFALCACGSSAEAAYDKAGTDIPSDGEAEVDPLLEDLAEQGNVKTEKGVTYSFGDEPGPVLSRLYHALKDIQYGRSEDTHGWTEIVDIPS